ncbi:MAG: hypothetical protein CL725_12795 [Chloroflexi bacterium]|nr:hypothetical protein [Chloroflexota bacterium]|tara:strand:- start:9310 stop:9939 length:630 start_codon:yes stop_codon:yes gene_type:complete
MNPGKPYYQQDRSEILQLLHEPPKKILDIGCGKGGVANMLRSKYPGVQIVGFDKFVDQQFDYAAVFAEFHQVDLSAPWPELDYTQFDHILLLDVLEHLVDPDQALKSVKDRMRHDAKVVVSLPNFHAYGNLLEIVRTGRFQYRESGILDRTHLRFYGQDDARELLTQHFRIDEFVPHHLTPRSRVNKLASVVLGEKYAAYQNLFLCSKK